jgi:hypothetical protein
VEPTDAAGLLIAMVEGYGSLAKNAQDPKVIKAGIKNIVGWLRSLRQPGNRIVLSDSQHRDRAKRFKLHHESRRPEVVRILGEERLGPNG